MTGGTKVAVISLMIEGQNGLNWPRWRRIVAEAEALGFAGLFRSDHFTNGQPPDLDSLEMIVSLAYVADHSSRIHFGPLVAPLSFRHPVQLARQAAALDDLSGGRMILGLGAGWQEREHDTFGFTLGDLDTRMRRFEEGLQVVTRLLREDGPVTFEGQFFHLREATLLPRPQRPGGPRILIGGTGPKRTLPLVARYADIWNGTFISASEYGQRQATLDGLLRAAGRKPEDVKRTVMCGSVFARDEAELERLLAARRQRPELAGKSLDEVGDALAERGFLVGTPDTFARRLREYADAGAEEIMVQWLDLDDVERLQAFAQSVVAQFR